MHPTWISCLQPAVQHLEVPDLYQRTLVSPPAGVPENKNHLNCTDGEMRSIRNNIMICECLVALLTLGITSVDCVGEPILWSSIGRILVFIHYSLLTEILRESFGTLPLCIQTSLSRALMDHM